MGGGQCRDFTYGLPSHTQLLWLSVLLHISRNLSECVNMHRHILLSNTYSSHWVSLLVIYFEKVCIHFYGIVQSHFTTLEVLCVLFIPLNT